MLPHPGSAALPEPPTFAALDPPASLGGAVAALHFHRSDRPGAVFRRLPMPWHALVVTLGAQSDWRAGDQPDWRPFPRVALCGLTGAWTEARDPADGPALYAMALIQPWAVEALTGLPPVEANGRVLDLEALDPATGSLRASADPGAALARLAGHLTARAKNLRPCDPRIAAFLAAAHDQAGAVSIADSARAAGLSERAFRDLFRGAMGLSPKAWAVLERFGANLRRLHIQPWAGAPAEDPDYFDQSHELREFKRLAGATPGAYRRMKASGDARVFAIDLEPPMDRRLTLPAPAAKGGA